MISTSGHTLLPLDAIDAIRSSLLPLCDLITPNIPEAQALAGRTDYPINTLQDMLILAQHLADTCGVQTILVKGGHLTVRREEVLGLSGEYPIVWDEGDDEGDTVEVLGSFRKLIGGEERSEGLVVDILVEGAGEERKLFVGRKLESTSTHGTGCTLSSAIACCWALYDQESHPEGQLLYSTHKRG